MMDELDPVYIDATTTCNIDVAVAKLLGWMQGTRRKKYINADALGLIEDDELPYLHSLEQPLIEMLSETSDVIQHHIDDALIKLSECKTEIESNDLNDQISQLLIRKEKYLRWQEKAHVYSEAIKNELAKEANSRLIINPVETERLGDTVLELESLRDWAKSEFDISIDGCSESATSSTNKAKQERYDAIAIEIHEILLVMENPTATKVMHALRAKIKTPMDSSTCVMKYDGEVLTWESNQGEKTLTMKALAERIRHWKIKQST